MKVSLAFLLVLCLTLGSLACSTNVPRYTPSKRVEAETVFVLPFERVEGRDQYAGTTDFGNLFAEYLAGALQERGVDAVAVGRGGSPPAGAHHIVRGMLVDLDARSWNLRF